MSGVMYQVSGDSKVSMVSKVLGVNDITHYELYNLLLYN